MAYPDEDALARRLVLEKYVPRTEQGVSRYLVQDEGAAYRYRAGAPAAPAEEQPQC